MENKENILPVVDKFIDSLWLEDGLSKNTLESYRYDLKNFSIWYKKDLIEVNQSDIQAYLAFKFPSSKSRSISRLLATLRRFYRYLLREKIIKEDPTLMIEMPKQSKTLTKSLNEEEVENLLNAPNIDLDQGLRDKAMLELLYACGLRVTELVSILLTELSINDGVIRVTGKGSKTRIVPRGSHVLD